MPAPLALQDAPVACRPLLLGAALAFVEPLAGGDAGTWQSLTRMRTAIESARGSLPVRDLAVSLVRDLPARDARQAFQAILDFVRSRVRYTADPASVELIQTPDRLLREIATHGTAAGDCDDMTVLVAALCEALGYPTRFVVLGPADGPYLHVAVEAQEPGGRWTVLDATRTDGGIGIAPHHRGGRRATAMLGQVDWNPYEYGYDYGQTPTSPAAVYPTETQASAEDWFAKLVGGVKELAPSVMGILERTGAYKPVTGYTATGQPVYASSVIPATGTQAAYTALTQTGPLGLSMGAWLLLGGAGLVLALAMRRR